MNEREMDAVVDIARREGLSFDTAADRFMMYGTGETARREQEREQWNTRVDARKQAKRDAKRWRK